MPKLLLAMLLWSAALAGCVGSGDCGDDCPGEGGGVTSTGPDEACGPPDDKSLADQPPGLAQRATSDVEQDGNRTLRWDLVIDGACQDSAATVTVAVTLAEPPQNCPALMLRAAVSTGTSEAEVALDGQASRQGSHTFMPQRTDLGPGPASFVVSLAATFPAGFPVQDEQCLDGTLQAFGLAAEFRASS